MNDCPYFEKKDMVMRVAVCHNSVTGLWYADSSQAPMMQNIAGRTAMEALQHWGYRLIQMFNVHKMMGFDEIPWMSGRPEGSLELEGYQFYVKISNKGGFMI